MLLLTLNFKKRGYLFHFWKGQPLAFWFLSCSCASDFASWDILRTLDIEYGPLPA